MFVTFEGIDGCGKSTILKEVYNMLLKEEIPVVATREPGGTEVAEKIREILLNNDIDRYTEALLFAAARREHVVKTILPALDEGKVVLCDRFIDSSYAYQGVEIGTDKVKEINKYALYNQNKFINPDLVIYLDIKPEVGLKRIYDRNLTPDRFDNQSLEKHRTIRNQFFCLARSNPNYVIINATRPISDIVNEVYNIIITKLGGNK